MWAPREWSQVGPDENAQFLERGVTRFRREKAVHTHLKRSYREKANARPGVAPCGLHASSTSGAPAWQSCVHAAMVVGGLPFAPRDRRGFLGKTPSPRTSSTRPATERRRKGASAAWRSDEALPALLTEHRDAEFRRCGRCRRREKASPACIAGALQPQPPTFCKDCCTAVWQRVVRGRRGGVF